MSIEKSWPSLLPNAMSPYGHQVEVINGSISGDTTGNGLARLPALLQENTPDVVLVELGANDGLRGFPPKTIQSNLRSIITQSLQSGADVILMQIRIPPNYGKRYNSAFNAIYSELGEQMSVPVMPFFLEQVIVKPEWMMSDGLHPKPDAQPWIAEFVAKHLNEHI